ncbi:MAG: hypothetical protein AAGD96_26440, partial [Chloroflexota bacterium]
EMQKSKSEQRKYVIWQSWREVFQELFQIGGFGTIISYTSYLVMLSLFTEEQKSWMKLTPN